MPVANPFLPRKEKQLLAIVVKMYPWHPYRTVEVPSVLVEAKARRVAIDGWIRGQLTAPRICVEERIAQVLKSSSMKCTGAALGNDTDAAAGCASVFGRECSRQH